MTNEENMEEYVGHKVKRTNKYVKLTQLVKIQQFIEKFGYNGGSYSPSETPSRLVSILSVNAQGYEPVTEQEHKEYQFISGITNHMMQ